MKLGKKQQKAAQDDSVKTSDSGQKKQLVFFREVTREELDQRRNSCVEYVL